MTNGVSADYAKQATVFLADSLLSRDLHDVRTFKGPTDPGSRDIGYGRSDWGRVPRARLTGAVELEETIVAKYAAITTGCAYEDSFFCRARRTLVWGFHSHRCDRNEPERCGAPWGTRQRLHREIPRDCGLAASRSICARL